MEVQSDRTRVLVARRIDLKSVDPEAWDRDLVVSEGSLHSAHHHLSRLPLRSPLEEVKVFAIDLADGGVGGRIGTFTIVRTGGVSRFHDGLKLCPEHVGLWPEAMRAALAACGPGNYAYGWAWSLEPPRETLLCGIDGVVVVGVEGIELQGVDFSRWPDWGAYYQRISQNSRRNARKAEKTYGDLRIAIKKGYASLLALPRLARLRQEMYRRKNMRFHLGKRVLGYIRKAMLFPEQNVVAYVVGGRKVRAAIRLSEFGPITYYFDGAASAAPHGAAWYLMLNLLRRAYERAPNGKFLMGYHIRGTEPHPGVVRSRASLRVSQWPTSIVSFRYEAVA